MRRASRTDANHAQIRDQLRKFGLFVWNTHTLGQGFPDLLVVVRGEAILLEVKDPAQPPSRRELTKAEKEFFNAYPGPVFVVHSVEQALEVLGMAKKARGRPLAATPEQKRVAVKGEVAKACQMGLETKYGPTKDL